MQENKETIKSKQFQNVEENTNRVSEKIDELVIEEMANEEMVNEEMANEEMANEEMAKEEMAKEEMVLQLRDIQTERILNKALASGRNVWVIGDVHGYANVLENLIEKLDLEEGDQVVLAGDMIDRGPNSCRVVEIVRDNVHIHTVKGNHEDMMVEAFSASPLSKEIASPSDAVIWIANGGKTTIKSFVTEHGSSADSVMREVATWMSQLPSQLVLDGHRIVHAGYHPTLDLEFQTDAEMLWIRDAFHSHKSPIDPARQVVFGHTPTFSLKVSGGAKGIAGEPMFSPVLLEDGRPAWVAIDTCAFAPLKWNPTLTAYNLSDGEFRRVRTYGD